MNILSKVYVGSDNDSDITIICDIRVGQWVKDFKGNDCFNSVISYSEIEEAEAEIFDKKDIKENLY